MLIQLFMSVKAVLGIETPVSLISMKQIPDSLMLDQL